VTNASLLTDEIRAAIGATAGPYTLEVSRATCRMFARACGYTDRIFYDAEAARQAGYRDIVAPPGYLGTWPHDPERPENRSLAPEVPSRLTRGLNGGTDIEYQGDICAGDTLTAVGKVVDVKERTGGVGPMLVVSREVEFTNQQGEVVAVMRGTSLRY
jgi:acyl dehydratase